MFTIRKLKKLINSPNLFFYDMKAKKIKSNNSETGINLLIDKKIKSKNKKVVNKSSTSFKLSVVESSIYSMKLMEMSKKEMNSGCTEKAIDLADRAVAVDKLNLMAYIHCCDVRSKLDEKPLVMDYSEKLIEIYPDNLAAKINFVKCSLMHGSLAIDLERLFQNHEEVYMNDQYLELYIQYNWECKKACSKIGRNILLKIKGRTVPPKLQAMLGAYLYDGGLPIESLRLARDLLDQGKGFLIKKHGAYFEYVNSVYKFANNISDLSTLNLTEKISKGEEDFLKRIQDAHRVIVVGNSPREVGKENGKEIDAGDCVVRFNNFPSSEEIHKDYGSKCDVWVRSIGGWVDKRDETELSHILISGTNLLHRGFNLSNFKYLNDSTIGLSVFNQEMQYELISILDGPPSAGIMLLYIVYRIKGELNEKDVFGFGFVDQLDSTVKNIGNSPAGVRHHWQKELELYTLMIKGELK